jgi:hypothetical protein
MSFFNTLVVSSVFLLIYEVYFRRFDFQFSVDFSLSLKFIELSIKQNSPKTSYGTQDSEQKNLDIQTLKSMIKEQDDRIHILEAENQSF